MSKDLSTKQKEITLKMRRDLVTLRQTVASPFTRWNASGQAQALTQVRLGPTTLSLPEHSQMTGSLIPAFLFSSGKIKPYL